MSLKARRELVASIAPRYAAAGRAERQNILDELVAATGYHRKYAITLLGQAKACRQPGSSNEPQSLGPVLDRRRRVRRYTPAVRDALVEVWEAANRICSKRLVPFLPELVEVLQRHGHLGLCEETRKTLLGISPATVDRLLRELRRRDQPHGVGTTRRSSLLKQQVPVRTFADWDDARPGFVEADLVAHCSTRTDGSYLNTLVITDIATGWTECIALLLRDQELVLRALKTVRGQLPFPLLGLDTDNGSEFLNYALLRYCRRESITFTRSRPYRKNDQCHVEEKNGSVVRRLIGYDRYEGLVACQALTALYEVVRLYVNFFQPSMKLLSKQRQGSRVIKRYDLAQTPFQRVLASPHIARARQQAMREYYAQLDPVKLLQELERRQDRFWIFAHHEVRMRAPRVHRVMPNRSQPERVREVTTSLEKPDSGKPLATAGRESKMASHSPRRYRRTPKPRRQPEHRWWRTRKDPFAEVWEEIREQLESTPYVAATAVLASLQKRHPGRFHKGQLRTLQRRLKTWRMQQSARTHVDHETVVDLRHFRASRHMAMALGEAMDDRPSRETMSR